MDLKKQSNPCFLVLVFVFNVICISSVDGAKCSYVNRYMSLTKRERHCFTLSYGDESLESPETPEELLVNFLGIESHYHVPQMYTFFPPNVSVICECACDDFTSNTCSDETYFRHDKCARHKSDHSVCTLYYNNGRDDRVCPDTSYKVCCQVYFSIPNTKGSRYHGMYLNKLENSMQVSLALNLTVNGIEKQAGVFHIPKHVRRFIFDNDTVITLSVVSPNEALPDDWYFVQDDSLELMTGINLNKIGDQDFKKLGWFQMGRFGPEGREELLTIDTHLLENFLKIYPLKCQANNPRVDWDFPAKYFQKVGGIPPPVYGKSAMQVHGLFVSNITVNIDKQSVIVDHRNPPELRVMVSKSNELLEDLVFNASLYSDKNSDFTLTLNFYSGKKMTYLTTVSEGHREISEEFYITIYKSQTFPVEHSVRLRERISSPAWVCLYEQANNQKQMCQLVEVYTNDTDNGANAQSDYMAHANNYEMKESYQGDTYLRVLVIVALCLAIVSILAQAVFYFCFYKKSKQRNPVNRASSFDGINKDPGKEDKTDSDGNRYSHLYEFLKPTHAVKPLANGTGVDSV